MSDTPFRYCLKIQTKPSAKSVLVALAYFAGESGECQMAISKLERLTCLSYQAVSRNIKVLIDAGHITRKTKPGRNLGSKYNIVMRKQVEVG